MTWGPLYDSKATRAYQKSACPQQVVETFEKCSILFKVKSKIPDFELGKARILTTGIPIVFRGLEFESDAACPAIAS
jgi:hypothetical protein